MRLTLLIASLLPFVNADGIKEPKGSKVSVLNKDLFPRFISRSSLVLMEWYAPWCGHCQELAPIFREAADRLSEMKKAGEIPQAVKFAKMNDGDEYNHAGRFGAPENYNFSAYPALYIFKDGDLKNPTPYYGGREVDDIVFWMASVAKGLDPIEEEIKARPGLYKGKTTDVLELSPESFNATVKLPSNMNNNAIYIVEFYSDRCPYCKILSPEVIEASKTLQSDEPRAIIGACNTRIYNDVAEQNGITGYPWVAAFYNGKKVEDMAGLGGADSIVNFAKRMVSEHFDESHGTPLVRQVPTYDEEGIMILDSDRIQWFEQDKIKWEEIEAQKIAGTYIEPEPETPLPSKKSQEVQQDGGDNHHEEVHQGEDEDNELPPAEVEYIEDEELPPDHHDHAHDHHRDAHSHQADDYPHHPHHHEPPKKKHIGSGYVANPENMPPPKDAKLGPMVSDSKGDAIGSVLKAVKEYEQTIDQYKKESKDEAKKRVFGLQQGNIDGVDVEVELNKGAVSQSDVDKGAAWRATLGRQTWFFLHTLAAKYPEYPSEIDQRAIRNLIGSLGQLYPCKLCRSHLRLKLMDEELGPVRTENRTTLSTWFCELHNMVNIDTNKNYIHDCSPFNLDLQYLKDCGECEGPSASKSKSSTKYGSSNMYDETPVFDARHYAKDGIQYYSEMQEAMDALSSRMAELDYENILLKKAWPSDVPRPI